MTELDLAIQWQWMYAFGLWVLAAMAVWIGFFPKRLVHYPQVVTWLLILYGASEAVLGLCQVYGFSASRHSLYALTGTFYNPGPYSGSLALVFPLCLHECLKRRGGKKSIPYYISLLVLFAILCVLPAGMSRSAWAAALLSSGYLCLVHFRSRAVGFIKRYGWLLLVAGIIGSAGLYRWKKDSADGRLFMWKIAAHAVSERPLSGYGWDKVPGAYGQAQEEYFASGSYTEVEEHVAGSPEYVFNEYLQVALAWGIPVLVMCLLGVGGCLYVGHRHREYGLCGAWVSLLVFAFSSYPLQFPAFVAALFLLASGCAWCCLPAWSRSVRAGMVVLLVAGCGACYRQYGVSHRRVEACREWRQCRMLYQSGAYARAATCYSSLAEDMEWSARFLFEYGHALHKCHRTEESTEVLQKALSVSSDPMILNVIGKNEQEQGHYESAEHWLLRSVHRLPGRIYPYFLLANLYAESGFYNREKLERMVQTVLEKEPKVQSTAVRQMRQKARELLSGKSQEKTKQ